MFHTRFNRIVSNVIIVGCGGTGSRLIPMVAQFMKSCPAILDPFITLIDGDTVEMKNLARQNFIKPDVGRHKSEVLAERYGAAIEIPIVSIPEYYQYSKYKDFRGWLQNHYSKLDPNLANRSVGSPIVFFAVDSMQARMEILAGIMYSRFRNHTWASVMPIIVDAGNENTFGQVSVYHAAVVPDDSQYLNHRHVEEFTRSFNSLSTIKKGYVGGDLNFPLRPAPVDMLVSALENPSEADVSCADLDQTAAINAQMAVGMFTAFQNICLNHKMTILTSYFDIHNGNSQTKIDDWLLNLPEEDPSKGARVTAERIAKALKKARDVKTLDNDSSEMCRLLASGTVDMDMTIIRDARQVAQAAIKDGSISKRNLELEALLNGRAA